jgi:hypothetical protein
MLQPAQYWLGPALQDVGSGAAACAAPHPLLEADPSTAATASLKVRLPFLLHQSRTFFTFSARAESLWV